MNVSAVKERKAARFSHSSILLRLRVGVLLLLLSSVILGGEAGKGGSVAVIATVCPQWDARGSLSL